ncbi:MAG: M24 family metallopeptidase [Candidatus Heimdallarchaeota archaeon]|nr:M24 family metallopeptidase [Candidatus Heimdallarchaeota archaeon]MBY8993762.1 M24 family metallopeptidase [Candidatus Heimdallarchaeota archaeon]
MKDARTRWEILNLIRKEKFRIILPIAMRENEIDMWIHVMREGNPDPLTIDLGGDNGYFVFTDRGEDRIERAVFGGDEELLHTTEVYDIFGSVDELKQFIEERNPKTIAINMSDWLAVADGLSYTGYKKLIRLVGVELSTKLTSAEQLITDFRTRRILSEIVVYGQLCEIARQLLERALSNEVITPGKTTLEDVGWWMEDQLLKLGMSSTFAMSTPMIIHSAKSEKEDYRSSKYIIQQGDLMQYDYGISAMNFGTDFKRVAYVLRKGETTVPAGIQFGWDQAIKARAVIRDSIKIGVTAEETLTNIGENLKKAGFEYIHLTIDPMDGGGPSLEPREDQEYPGKTEITVDCHCVGNTGNSEVASGPSIAGFRPDRAHLIIKPNNLFAFEFIAYTPNEEWDGEKVRFNLEDNAIVTENGVEFLYPPNERILLIH